MRLKLTEIFYSLQGEADTVGIPTVFVRLTGCPLRCQYCDTAYAFHGGEWWELSGDSRARRRVRCAPRVRHRRRAAGTTQCLALLSALADAGYRVSLETSGAMPIDAVDPRVIRVVDVKTPGSGEEHRNRYEQLAAAAARKSRSSSCCAIAPITSGAATSSRPCSLAQRCQVLFSPSHEQLPARQLADWILADRLPVRFQIQLHKYLWGNEPGR